MSSGVLWNLRPQDTGRQLITFPFLGGFGASYNLLIKQLQGDWDVWTVNPPGHGPTTRPPLSDLGELVDCYLNELQPMLRPGAVLFGHSMGGLIAYHVLIAMRERREFQGRLPSDLVLSGCRAPGHLPVTGFAVLSDADLLAHLLGFGAIPQEVAEDASLIDLFLPAFRADYGVLEQAHRASPKPLEIRTRLLLGDRDPQTPAGTAAAWQAFIADPIEVHTFRDAEHMFVLEAPELVAGILDPLTQETVSWTH